MKNPNRSYRAQCKGYHPDLRKYSRAKMECYNEMCFRVHPRAQGASKPHLRPRYQVQLPELQSNNNLWSPHKIWLTTASHPCYTPQHATATHPAPSPTHYHTPPPTQYLTTHQTTVPLHSNPPPLNAIPYTTSSSSTLTQSLHPPVTSALTPQSHYPSFPRIVIPPQSHTPHLNTQDGYQRTTPRVTTANDHNIF